MQRAENRRQRGIVKVMREKRIKTFTTITDDMIVGDFKDAALELTWKQAIRVVGLEYGLCDELGRPVNAWARRIFRRAKPVYSQARRDYLQDKKRWAAFHEKSKEENKMTPTPNERERAVGPLSRFLTKFFLILRSTTFQAVPLGTKAGKDLGCKSFPAMGSVHRSQR
jgi:hypothetical protein